jgi:MYXO-CTERM domain-containing protein
MRRFTKLALAAAAALATAGVRDARACGGCFHPPSQNGTVVTDHRMIFTVSPQATTLYDQIKYSGDPASFAWVLPIHGQVKVGLSADIVFQALDSATATTIVAPNRQPCPFCGCAVPGAGLLANAAAADAGAASSGVTVLTQQVVGPYDTVQLHPNTTSDTASVTAWLTSNGYTIPSDVQPIIAAYVAEGSDFLALRLQPGQGVQAMRPVSVTTPGAGLTLPLRMVAAGTGATVGITLWVIGSGRYEPQNFPKFTIDPASLVWDWSTNLSDYSTVQTSDESQTQNFSWQIESSLDVTPLKVENTVLYGYYSSFGGGVAGGPIGGVANDASTEYLAVPASDGGVGQTAADVRTADLATLFPLGTSTVRITRMRGDLSRAALANDLVLQASADQSTLSNVYQVTQSVNLPVCPVCTPEQNQCGGFVAGGQEAGAPGAGGNAGLASDDAGSPSPSSLLDKPRDTSFTCSTSPAVPAGAGAGMALAGLALVARARRRERTRKPGR